MQRPRSVRGSVTAETALVLPAVIIMMGVVLAVGAVVGAQIRCVDAARAAARLAARGEDAARVRAAARDKAPAGGRVVVSIRDGLASVAVEAAVSLPVPGLPAVPVRGTAVADVETP